MRNLTSSERYWGMSIAGFVCLLVHSFVQLVLP